MILVFSVLHLIYLDKIVENYYLVNIFIFKIFIFL